MKAVPGADVSRSSADNPSSGDETRSTDRETGRQTERHRHRETKVLLVHALRTNESDRTPPHVSADTRTRLGHLAGWLYGYLYA